MLKGCIGKLITLIIAVLSVIVVIVALSFAGVILVKEIVNKQSHPTPVELRVRSEKIADFSNIPQGYFVTRAYDLFGVVSVIAEHEKTQQKMMLVDPSWVMNVSKSDVENGELSEKFERIAAKMQFPNFTVKTLKFGKTGTLAAFGQEVPYQNFTMTSSGDYNYNIEGIVGVVRNEQTGKNNLVISYADIDNFNFGIAEKFFRKVEFE